MRGQRIKRVSAGRAELIHVETELGIVNIHLGLRDMEGRRVERVSMIPDQYAGERIVTVEDGCRFVQETEDDMEERLEGKPKIGARSTCDLCESEIEWSGDEWQDRGGGIACLPFMKRGEVVTPKEGSVHAPEGICPTCHEPIRPDEGSVEIDGREYHNDNSSGAYCAPEGSISHGPMCPSRVGGECLCEAACRA